MARPPSAANNITTKGQPRAGGVKHQMKPLCQPSAGVGHSGHVDAVRIFFTIIKGAPSARQADRPRPRLARMRGTCTGSVNELGSDATGPRKVWRALAAGGGAA